MKHYKEAVKLAEEVDKARKKLEEDLKEYGDLIGDLKRTAVDALTKANSLMKSLEKEVSKAVELINELREYEEEAERIKEYLDRVEKIARSVEEVEKRVKEHERNIKKYVTLFDSLVKGG